MLAGLPGADARRRLEQLRLACRGRQDYNDKFDIKVDQQFNAATSAFVRFSHRKVEQLRAAADSRARPAVRRTAIVEVLNQQLAGGVTRTLSAPRRCSRSASACRAPRPARPRSARAARTCSRRYGITGLPTDTVLRRRPDAAVGERLDGLGPPEQQPAVPESVRRSTRASTTRGSAGAHTLKTGYEYQHINTDVDDVHPKYGADGYGGQFSRPTGAAADPPTYNLADFLFGARNTYELVNPFVFDLRQRMHFGYVQDDWRATPELTLNLGLRYEFGTPQWEDDNYLTNFDPATNTLLQAQRRLDLRPRAGAIPIATTSRRASASPTASTPKTVIRSAYGISYIHFNRLGGENLLSFNGPHVVPIAITQQPSQGLCAATRRRRPASARRRRATRRG